MQEKNTTIKTGISTAAIEIINTKQKNRVKLTDDERERLFNLVEGIGERTALTVTEYDGRKRIYICGKVTGEDWSDVKLKFAAAEEYVKGCDCEAINPVTLVNDENCNWQTAMKTCISVLMGCDAIYMLPCWPKSRGAVLERYIAGSVGIEIIEAEKI